MAEPLLLGAARAPTFFERPDGEKRAIVGALVRLESEASMAWVRALFAEKSPLLNRRRVDDKKLMAIGALQSMPGMPSLRLLAEVARDNKTHSSEVCEAAKAAALEVQKRVLGNTGGDA
jgi:hypothetical protein